MYHAVLRISLLPIFGVLSYQMARWLTHKGFPACQATFYALRATYGYLSPELWTATRYTKSPMQEFTDFLAKPTVGDLPRVPPVTTY